MSIQRNLPDWCGSCSSESETVRALRTTKMKVAYLYKKYEATRGNDKILLQYFRYHFGSTLYKEDGIKRVGRLLRHENKQWQGDSETQHINTTREYNVRMAIGTRSI